MIEKPINFIKDDNLRDIIKHIYDNGAGNLIELSAAPTATAPLLKSNQKGIFGNNIFHRVGTTIYRFNSDAQITITSDVT